MPSSVTLKFLYPRWLWVVLLYVGLVYGVTALRPPPAAVALGGPARVVTDATLLIDESWLDNAGTRQVEQQLFDAELDMIARAQNFILLDMFLYNTWQGPVKENFRALAAELTEALIARKHERPALRITVISDPLNTAYGALESPHFEALKSAGIVVVITDLTALQDSNPLYSGLWRWLIRPFGNGPGTLLPNPFGGGRVSLRSYLALANFKANHRKLLIADDSGGQLMALVTSANPHDGSSAHRNVALRFAGDAVNDLLIAEQAVLALSGSNQQLTDSSQATENLTDTGFAIDSAAATDRTAPAATLQLLNESRIKHAILQQLEAANAGDMINLAMFYLAERDVINALKAAHTRGTRIRVLLDVNRDAFGRQKNGVPNRPVAAELNAHGVTVRWCETLGEQCHAKWLHTVIAGRHSLLVGSGNFTRRNLDDYNLETDVLLVSDARHPAIARSLSHFETQWNNTPSRTYSSAYDQYADESVWLELQYRLMEASGISTF